MSTSKTMQPGTQISSRYRVAVLAALPLLACGEANKTLQNENVGTASQALEPGVVARLTGNTVFSSASWWLSEGDTHYSVVETTASEARPGPGVVDAHRLPGGIVITDPVGTPTPACIHGSSCLAFIGYTWPEPNGLPRSAWNDRLQVVLSAADAPDAFRLDEWRYVRLYVNIGAETELQQAGEDARILDVMQSARGTPYHPPGVSARALPPAFMVNLKNGGSSATANLEFSYNNDAGTGAVFFTREVAKGAWHNFHIAMKASPSGNSARGSIQVWVDQGINFAFEPSVDPANKNNMQFYWGFQGLNVDAGGGTCTSDSGDCVKKRFDMRAGLIRSNSLSGSGGVAAGWVHLDSIKVTTSASVMKDL